MAGEPTQEAVSLTVWSDAIMPDVAEREELQKRLIEQNLKAATLTELFEPRKTVASKDVVGVPLEIRNVLLAKGEIEGKDSVYMLVDAIDLNTGEKIVLNTGAPNVMSMLYNIKQRQLLPIQVAIIEVGTAPSPGMNRPLSLEPVGTTIERMAQGE